jgi:hypothetical protein
MERWPEGRRKEAPEAGLFDLAIDSKLRGCDLVTIKIGTLVTGQEIRTRAMVSLLDNSLQRGRTIDVDNLDDRFGRQDNNMVVEQHLDLGPNSRTFTVWERSSEFRRPPRRLLV